MNPLKSTKTTVKLFYLGEGKSSNKEQYKSIYNTKVLFIDVQKLYREMLLLSLIIIPVI